MLHSVTGCTVVPFQSILCCVYKLVILQMRILACTAVTGGSRSAMQSAKTTLRPSNGLRGSAKHDAQTGGEIALRSQVLRNTIWLT